VPPQASSGSEAEEEALEPEDPEQPCCAISGEPFEKFFDQDKEEWFYRGATRIHGDEAARYGVADASLVKAKCLAEAGLGSGAAAMVAAGGLGQQPLRQEGDAETAMAAAAAGAPAAGQAVAEQQQQQQQPAEANGDHAEDPQQQQQEDELPAAAAVVVKQEAQEAAEFKSEALQDSKMEDAAAAAVQQAGTKREASAEAAADEQQGELGSAAKRAKLEQAV
jgi:pre-mRNA cleavage complex 2 protein Pcf11